ncbi:ABC transporter permease [uncultured Friedmanniella sp.]|uniref:ABC transporter permease n=1 Tax=uncultured Friedmanniella sp. TaxID=335381 RepID=UPI0035CB0974
MHALRVLRAFLAVGVANIVQYRSDFAISLVNAVVTLVTSLLGLSVIFGLTSDLHGWTADDLIVLIGIHGLISGVVGLVIRPSMEAMMEGIRLGTFDFVLTKPVDAQLLASARVMAPQALIDVVVGVGVIGYGLTRIGAGVTVLGVALFAVTLVAGFAIVYSFLLILSTMAFWFVKLDNILVVFQALFGNAGRWPVPIFPGWMRPVLTFVVPIAFAVTVPAQALTGQLSVGGAVASVGLAALFLLASRLFWRVALRRYTGASA